MTTNGPLADHPYFIRLSKTGDPNAAITYNVGNGGPTLDQREVIDAGFLELTRLGELPPTTRTSSIRCRSSMPRSRPTRRAGRAGTATTATATATGPTDGHPWAPSGQGTGHLWPVLSAERGEQSIQTGDLADAAALLDAMARFSSGVGIIPEQDWELPDLAASPFGTDPTIASIGFVNGKPAGSASPLTWSAGAFVRLFADIAANKLVDQPAATVDRYITHTQGQTTLTVTAPADTLVDLGVAGDRHGHDRARQHGRRPGHEHRPQLGDDLG